MRQSKSGIDNLLENLRIDIEKEGKLRCCWIQKKVIAGKLRGMYVNDSFGIAYTTYSSCTWDEFVEGAAEILIKKELNCFTKSLRSP